MKLAVFIFCAFIVGVGVGAQVARYEYTRIGVEQVVGVIREGVPHAEIELRTIELAEKADTKQIIRLNCMLLRGELKGIKAEDYEPSRASEVRDFLVRAQEKIINLQQSDSCSFSSPAQPK